MGFILIPLFLVILALLVLGIKLYRRLHSGWKLYAIPAYLTLCFFVYCFPFWCLEPQGQYFPIFWLFLSAMVLATVLWWGLIQVLRRIGWVYKQLRP